jgi:hypothetical protein
MPIVSFVNAATRLGCLRITDPHTIDDWKRGMDEILHHAAFSPGFSFLIDRRGALPPSVAFVHAMAGYLAAHADRLAGGRVAVVVRENDALAYGMARMVENLNAAKEVPQEVRTFTRLDDAEAWLGAPCRWSDQF